MLAVPPPKYADDPEAQVIEPLARSVVVPWVPIEAPVTTLVRVEDTAVVAEVPRPISAFPALSAYVTRNASVFVSPNEPTRRGVTTIDATSPWNVNDFVPTTTPFHEIVTVVEKPLPAKAVGRATVIVPEVSVDTAVTFVGVPADEAPA
jgi:hypothetical protein